MSTTAKEHIAAAERKTGLTAAWLYIIGLFFAGLYVFFISTPMFMGLSVESPPMTEENIRKEVIKQVQEILDNPEENKKIMKIVEKAIPLPEHPALFRSKKLIDRLGDLGNFSKEMELADQRRAERKREIEEYEQNYSELYEQAFKKRINYLAIYVDANNRKSLEKENLEEEVNYEAQQAYYLSISVVLLLLYILSIDKYGIIRLPNFMGVVFLLPAVVFFTLWTLSVISNDIEAWVSLWFVFVAVIVPFLIFIFKPLYFVGNEAFKELRLFEQWTKTFSGRPSGRWGGFLAHWHFDVTRVFERSMGDKIKQTKYSPIMIGKTIMEYDYRIFGRYIGTQSEQHLITVAGVGAGKSYTAANNVLSSYCGGMVVLDVKGEHTKHCYERRSAYAPFYNIDPFGITGKPPSRWNIMAEIDIHSSHARSDLDQIVESLVIRESGDDKPHFIQIPRMVVRGFMAHILTTYPKEKQNLVSLYELVAKISANDNETQTILEQMKANEALGNSPRDAANEILKFSDRSGADHWATITRSLDWINDDALKTTISGHDFSFSECKTKNATVSLALPANKLLYFKRFVRLFFSMALIRLDNVTTPQPEGSERRVLFMLDEFAKLGRFELIEEAFNIGRGSYLKMWIFLQNLGQLKNVFENPDNFIGNADIQAFGIKANDDKDFLSEALGQYVDKSYPDREVETRVPKELMNKYSISNFLDAKTNNQIFLPFEGYPLRLKRIKTFKS